MNLNRTKRYRIDSKSDDEFSKNCDGIKLKPSEVIRELVSKFNQDPKLQNSIRVNVNLKNRNDF